MVSILTMASDVNGVWIWCASPKLVKRCTREAKELLSAARKSRQNRTRGEQRVYTSTDTGVIDQQGISQRSNTILIFASGPGLFKRFLETNSFGIGGTPFSKAPILNQDQHPALTELTRQVAHVFQLAGLVPVVMQVLEEEAGYELPWHMDRPDWVCAVSIALGDGAAEWYFRLPGGETKVIVSPGQCWAVSWFGDRVMKYDTPHAHAPLLSPRVVVVVRFKRVPNEIPFDYDAWWSTHGSGQPLTKETIEFLRDNLK